MPNHGVKQNKKNTYNIALIRTIILENMKTKKLLKSILNKLGVEVKRYNQSCEGHQRLKVLKSLGFNPTHILDGGAHCGAWTAKTSEVFPNASFVLIEPNPEMSKSLKDVTVKSTKTIIPKALDNQDDLERDLYLWDDRENTGASLLPQVSKTQNRSHRVKTITIDTLCQKLNIFPELIKLDLQGNELAALQGSKKSLERAEVLIVEFGCLNNYENRTTPNDILTFLYPYGFKLFDVIDLNYRPSDSRLCGGDFILAKGNLVVKQMPWDKC
jgi:FkbM family methyltransferase